MPSQVMKNNMERKRIWPIEQTLELTKKMDEVVFRVLSHHQVQINMILVAELEGREMTFNYNYKENLRNLDFEQLLKYAISSFREEVNIILSPELGIHISKISHGKYLVVHRDVDFGDVLAGQHTQRAIRTLSNEFHHIFHPLLPAETLQKDIPDNVYQLGKVA